MPIKGYVLSVTHCTESVDPYLNTCLTLNGRDKELYDIAGFSIVVKESSASEDIPPFLIADSTDLAFTGLQAMLVDEAEAGAGSILPRAGITPSQIAMIAIEGNLSRIGAPHMPVGWLANNMHRILLRFTGALICIYTGTGEFERYFRNEKLILADIEPILKDSDQYRVQYFYKCSGTISGYLRKNLRDQLTKLTVTPKPETAPELEVQAIVGSGTKTSTLEMESVPSRASATISDLTINARTTAPMIDQPILPTSVVEESLHTATSAPTPSIEKVSDTNPAVAASSTETTCCCTPFWQLFPPAAETIAAPIAVTPNIHP
ncbi:MAG: hypothetical protein Q7V63_06620 [Gammaproteobacteria bacterium]|nr:hypothetical protein [Gammaproteobacteria bacterium]